MAEWEDYYQINDEKLKNQEDEVIVPWCIPSPPTERFYKSAKENLVVN